jgi:flagella basal body P-ring formation protein FlgA
LRESDVRKPVQVAKGSTVTMVFQAPGITLTGMGRAMGEGGLGDVVVVLNPSSYRQISATVTGPGTVRAEGLMANVPMANAAMTNAARAPRMAAAANRFSN